MVPMSPLPLPVQLSWVAAGGDVSCAANSGDQLICWGDSLAGIRKLGRASDFAEVHPGAPTCALTTMGAVTCWPRLDATPVIVLSGPVHALGIARTHGCALDVDSTAVCWPADLSSGPTPVAGGFKFATLSVGGAHACGMDASGTARCWGANDFGQLGDGAFTPADTPVTVHAPVPPDTAIRFVRIFAGDLHSCAIGTDRRAYCWGARDGGRDGLGDPDTGSIGYNIVPFAVHSSLVWDTLFAGGRMTCGYSGKILYCWGGNAYGGDGALGGAPNAVPVAVDGQGVP